MAAVDEIGFLRARVGAWCPAREKAKEAHISRTRGGSVEREAKKKANKFSLFLNLYLTPGNKTPTGKTLGPLGGLDGLRAWEVVH